MDTSYETQVDAADRCTWRSGGFLGAGTSRRERSTYLQCNAGLPGLVEPGYSYALGGTPAALSRPTAPAAERRSCQRRVSTGAMEVMVTSGTNMPTEMIHPPQWYL